MKKSKVVLIDGKNFCFRYHYTHRHLQDERGRPTGVLHGALMGLLRLQKEVPDTPLVWVWDGGGQTWRHTATDGAYKSNRKRNPDTVVVMQQLPMLQKMLRKIGCQQFMHKRLEGDDLIGVLTTAIQEKDLFQEIIIHSNDKDFAQLAAREGVNLLHSMDKDKKWKILSYKEMLEKFGCEPSKWIDVRALMGDSTDGVPGVRRGIGPKTALKMVAAGVDTEVKKFSDNGRGVKEMYPDLAAVWDKVKLNRRLVCILTHYNLEELPKDLRKEVESEVSSLKRKSFFRNEDFKTEEQYQWMLSWLSKYNLVHLIDRRRELWRLC